VTVTDSSGTDTTTVTIAGGSRSLVPVVMGGSPTPDFLLDSRGDLVLIAVPTP
jgi:hypothetical protein